MKKWRSLVSLAVMSTSLFTISPGVSQAVSCNPCDWDPCNICGFEVGADFLWWKPCFDDADYAFTFDQDDGRTDVKYKSICADWEPGFRVYIGFSDFYCDWGFRASYTYLDSCASNTTKRGDSDNVSSNMVHSDLLIIAGDYEEVKGSWDSCYQEFDALFTYNITCRKCHDFIPYFGVAGIYLEQELKVNLKNPSGENDGDEGHAKWNSEYWGVGLRFGSCYNYRICDCFSFFANAHGTLLAGENCAKNHQFVIDGTESDFKTSITFKDDENCHFVPGYQIGAGISYDTCVCDFDFSLEVGYDFVAWHNIPNHRVFAGDSDSAAEIAHSSSPSTRTLAYHGVSAGIGLSF